MADDNTQALRDEINTLRSQLEQLIKSAGEKRSEMTHEAVEKLTKELENLRKSAGDQAHKLYAAGQTGLDEISDHVRQHPLACLAVAFGTGCVLSCLMRHLR